MPRTKQKF